MDTEKIKYPMARKLRGGKTLEQILEEDRIAQEKEKEKLEARRAREPKRARAWDPEPKQPKPKPEPKPELKVVNRKEPQPERKQPEQPDPQPENEDRQKIEVEPPDYCTILNVTTVQKCKGCENKKDCLAGLNFGQIPHVFISDYMNLLKVSEIKVFLAISSRINFSEQSDFFNKVNLSYQEISELAGVSRGAVSEYLKTLEKLDLIKRTKVKDKTYISLVWLSKKLELKLELR